jgi:hypothetical protein
MKRTKRSVGLFAFVIAGITAVPAICAAQNQILLQGVVGAQCSIVVASLPAASALPLTSAGAQRIQVGTVVQNCNKKTGYTLTVTSANCATPTPAGAKVYDTVSLGVVPYSAEFGNPTTGGSLATVTGLLASSCSAATGRSVTGALVVNETSTVWVNYTGSALLAAGTYLDTLTLVMNVN